MENQTQTKSLLGGDGEGRKEIQETIQFIEKILLNVQGFVVSDELISKRGFDLFRADFRYVQDIIPED